MRIPKRDFVLIPLFALVPGLVIVGLLVLAGLVIHVVAGANTGLHTVQ